MSELALYRKYRPQTFDELVGQETVVKSLKGAIEKGALAHSYLFVGTRGVGKTSAARIFAKELGVSDKDLYELDAASNRGIDDFREISDSVHSLPFESPYKIYIIDEVHMLTKEAFNAFLKTLEEPPEYVIFILATTNPEKVPETIKSRCQVHEFKKADFKAISQLIKSVAEKEAYSIDEDALHLIAFVAEGSFRDAFGILQKAISVSKDKKISLQDLEQVVSVPPMTKAIELLLAMSNDKKEESFKLLQELDEQNSDIASFSKLLLDIMRDVLLLRFAGKEQKQTLKSRYTKEGLEYLEKLKEDKSKINSSLIKSLLANLEFMPYMHRQTLVLEIFVSEFFEKHND